MAFNQVYTLYICDKNYAKLTRVNYTGLQYSQIINGIPEAYATIQGQDPSANSIGFDFTAQTYCCIIEKNGTEVYRGEIGILNVPGNSTPLGYTTEEADGTLDRLELGSYSILQRLDDMVVTPDSGSTVFKRSFTSGTNVGDAFNTILSEAIARSPSPVSTLQVGVVENPVDSTGTLIQLNSAQALYAQSYLSWIQTLAALGNADWYIRDGNKVDFLKRKGSDLSATVKLTLKRAGATGNNLTGITLSVDRRNMGNRIIAAGAQNGIVTIASQAEDIASQNKHGLRERVYPALFGYQDVASGVANYAQTLLNQLKQDVPADTIRLYPVQDHQVLGSFGLGDTITLDIGWNLVAFTKPVRVVGVTVTVDSTGLERPYYNIQEPYTT